VETTTENETETVEVVREQKTPRRNLTLVVIVAIVAITLLTLIALAFMPGVRETRVARAIRFWEGAPPPAAAVPPGQLGAEMEQAQAQNTSGTITIDPNMAQSIGLQTAVVEARSFDQPVRTTGRVTPDERRITNIHTKYDGWVEQAFANFEGQQISKGQALLTIYSPDLVATQQEYLIALRARSDFNKSEFDVVRRSGSTLVEASRRRLQLLDVTPQQIAAIERTGRIHKALTFYSPVSGVVTERKVFPGMRIMPDTDLYTVADLSVIWVEADVFESDLSNVRIGTSAEVTLPNGETRGGQVTFINPVVVPETRTARVRLEFANPGMRLKPGMFVNVSLRAVQPPQIVVPRDAVLDTGLRKLVLVDDGQGRYSLREITTSTQGQEFYTVISGLSVGERVARNIQFLIDSETQLRQAIGRETGLTSPGTGQSGSSSGSMPNMPNMPGMSPSPK
jgi:Cu(I)/Ag(I) efflux system membrane fusion protein